LSRQLASTRGLENILQVAVKYISEIFDGDVLALLPDEKRTCHVAAGDVSSVLQDDILKQMNVARSAYDSGQMAGWGTRSSPTAEVLYVPRRASDPAAGIVALRPRDPKRFLLHEQVTLLESLAKQVALALEVELMSSHGLPPHAHTASRTPLRVARRVTWSSGSFALLVANARLWQILPVLAEVADL